MGRLSDWLNEEVTVTGQAKPKDGAPHPSPSPQQMLRAARESTQSPSANSAGAFFYTDGKLRKLRVGVLLVLALGLIAHLTNKNDPTSLTQAGGNGSCSSAARSEAQQLIQLRGWRCDYVNFCSLGGFTASFIRVTCNGHHYAYHIRDHGGRLMVDVQ